MATVHHHYHYHYYYPTDAQAQEVPDTASTSEVEPQPATQNVSESVPAVPAYVRQGREILEKDRGILSSYGYCNVEKQTIKYRRLALLEATQYLSKDYIQERLYFIATVQPEAKDSVFWEDLEWFERTFQLKPYYESESN